VLHTVGFNNLDGVPDANGKFHAVNRITNLDLLENSRLETGVFRSFIKVALYALEEAVVTVFHCFLIFV
jgi:hypothetical protein